MSLIDKTGLMPTLIGKQFVTPLAKGCLFVAIVACGASFYMWRFKPPVTLVKSQPIDDLNKQHSALSAYTDDKAQEESDDQKKIVAALWTDERFATWVKNNLPKHKPKDPNVRNAVDPCEWVIKEPVSERKRHVEMHRVVLECNKAAAADWPEIFDVLQKLNSEPGVVFVGLNLSMGNTDSRRFDLVQAVALLPFALPADANAK